MAGKEAELDKVTEPESIQGQKRFPFPHLDQMHGGIIPSYTGKQVRDETRQ